MTESVRIRRLAVDDLELIASIDRSEHVDIEYEIRDGRLVERPVSMAEIPAWDSGGDGPYSVAAQVAFCEPIVRGGAVFLGAFDGDEPLGLAVVDASFERALAWLAFLYVSRPHRRRGVAALLWNAAVEAARAASATSMYVSAVPTGSAVAFYLSRGCELADPVHPELHAREPDDVHFVCSLQCSVPS